MKSPLEIAQSFVESTGLEKASEEALRLLAAIIQPMVVKKGTVILEEGKVSKGIYFVEEGLLRQYYNKNGHNVSEHFTSPGKSCCCLESTFKRKPTHLMIEAEVDSILHFIPYDLLEQLSLKNGEIHLIQSMFCENALVVSQYKCDMLRHESAQDRYEHFIQEYPEAFQKAPMKHIASYLVLTPETLSRLHNTKPQS